MMGVPSRARSAPRAFVWRARGPARATFLLALVWLASPAAGLRLIRTGRLFTSMTPSSSTTRSPSDRQDERDLQPNLTGRAGMAELGATDVAAHHRQTPMAAVPHDFLVRHLVAVCRRDETSPQAVRGDRLEPRAFDASEPCPFQHDQANRLAAESSRAHRATMRHGAEHGALVDLDGTQPCLKSPHRTGRFRLPARDTDPRAFAFGVRLGPRDQQLEAAGLPGDVLDLLR
jgi:hypothetical protein